VLQPVSVAAADPMGSQGGGRGGIASASEPVAIAVMEIKNGPEPVLILRIDNQVLRSDPAFAGLGIADPLPLDAHVGLDLAQKLDDGSVG